jgi:hypothetical protein
MHQADQQRPPPETVLVRMTAAPMRNRIRCMAVEMEVRSAVAVAVLMEVHAVAPEPP